MQPWIEDSCFRVFPSAPAMTLKSTGWFSRSPKWTMIRPTRCVFGNFTWLDQDDRGRRQRELLFLKAAFDRLEAEAQQDPTGPATPSLRGEQEAVLRHMREVARPIPADAVPGDLRQLVKGEAPPAPQAPVVVSQPAEPADGASTGAGSPLPGNCKARRRRPRCASARTAPRW